MKTKSYAESTTELIYAWRRDKGTAKKLCQFAQDRDLVRGALSVLHGTHEIQPIGHIVNLGAMPSEPGNDWIMWHRHGGPWQYNPKQITFFVDSKQKNKKGVSGHVLRKKLVHQPIFNACLLDYLTAHPSVIPKNWEGERIYCWGTIFGYDFPKRNSRYVHYLCLTSEGWTTRSSCLEEKFDANCLAAMHSGGNASGKVWRRSPYHPI